jgi:hypothetical protein
MWLSDWGRVRLSGGEKGLGVVRGKQPNRVLVAIGALIAVIGTLGVAKAASDQPWAAKAEAARLTGQAAVKGPAPTTTTPSTSPPTTMPGFPVLQVPVETVLASPKGTISTYPSPGAAPTGRLGTWYGFALTLPVIAEQPGWLQVRLPQRPNGSTAWVQAADVTLSSTPYFMAVSLSADHLVVYQAGQPVLEFPAGIGLPATPTPAGHFFIAVRELHPDRFYGPVILDTSAHSEAIRSWEGMGDAVIAVHGPITSYADGLIGSTGTRVSNGCIRLHNADLARLAVIPAGTPLEIVP